MKVEADLVTNVCFALREALSGLEKTTHLLPFHILAFPCFLGFDNDPFPIPQF